MKKKNISNKLEKLALHNLNKEENINKPVDNIYQNYEQFLHIKNTNPHANKSQVNCKPRIYY